MNFDINLFTICYVVKCGTKGADMGHVSFAVCYALKR